MGASRFRKRPIYNGDIGARGRVALPISPSVGEKGISNV